eukprot:4125142-Pleurochrysis_carterae.AAC.2
MVVFGIIEYSARADTGTYHSRLLPRAPSLARRAALPAPRRLIPRAFAPAGARRRRDRGPLGAGTPTQASRPTPPR